MHNRRPLHIASTIGPIETGLLPALEAAFSRRTATPVEHDALGTGAALDRAKRGGIDLVIAHAPALEEQFIADGWALGRHPFTANDFLLVGPHDDPANARGAEAFLNWLLGDEAQALIGEFGRAEHGTGLFLRRDQMPST